VKHYNHVTPHSALGYSPLAPQTQVHQILQNQPVLLQLFTMKKLSLVVDLNWQQFKKNFIIYFFEYRTICNKLLEVCSFDPRSRL